MRQNTMRLMIGAFISCAVLQGCASDSGVINTGYDTYKVVRRSPKGFSHPGLLVAAAESEASDYCRKHEGVAVITAMQESPPPFFFGNYPTAQVRFFCRHTSAAAPTPASAGAPPPTTG